MDRTEYQELKQRCRNKARTGRRNSLYTLLLVSLIVFLLGVAGGLLLSAGRITKTSPTADLGVLRQPATEALPLPARPPSTVQEIPPLERSPQTAQAAEKKDRAPKQTGSVTKTATARRPDVKAAKGHPRAAATVRVSPYFPRFPGTGKTEETMAYASRVQSLIELHKVDSVTAAGKTRPASCTVVCIVKRDGSIKHAELVKSSGDAALDRAAVHSVTNARRFPAVPESMPGDEISFYVPVSFPKAR